MITRRDGSKEVDAETRRGKNAVSKNGNFQCTLVSFSMNK
jgi:hypothetical protein